MEEIRFDDGAAYEEFMGAWSRIAGETFLDWLAPAPELTWLDVGCGNGAFTELLVQRCAPRAVMGIDPSEAQLEFASTRMTRTEVTFELGDAMALPCGDGAFDVAVMALVIFFVPEPERGVAEMVRVVRPGGSVTAYAWDILGGGFPFAALQQEMARLGSPPVWPPSFEIARLDVLHALWTRAGLVDIEAREIRVERTFADFETWWRIAQAGPRIAARVAGMSPDDVATLRERLRLRLPAGVDGRITYGASANAIKGRVAAR